MTSVLATDPSSFLLPLLAKERQVGKIPLTVNKLTLLRASDGRFPRGNDLDVSEDLQVHVARGHRINP